MWSRSTGTRLTRSGSVPNSRSNSSGPSAGESRYCRNFSSPSKNKSMVTQNGPAFLERTCRQTSPILTIFARLFRGVRQIGPLGTNQFETVASVNDMVEHELINLAARNLGRREWKGIARHLDTGTQRHVEEVGVTGLRHSIGQILRRRGHDAHDADIAGRRSSRGDGPPGRSIPPVDTQ